MRIAVAILVAGALCATNSLYAQSKEPEAGLPAYGVLMSWDLVVTPYSNKADNDPIPNTPYRLHLIIFGQSMVDKTPCWRFVYSADGDVPREMNNQFLVTLMDPQTGWLRKAERLNGRQPVPTKLFGDVLFFSGPTAFFPIEMLPNVKSREMAAEGMQQSLSFTNVLNDGKNIREAVVKSGGVEQLRIRQTWRPGESCWSEYERFVNGKLELSARAAPTPEKKDTDVAAKLPKTDPRTPARERNDPDQVAKGPKGDRQSPEQASDRFYLRRDDRLKANTAVVATEPRREYLLKKLEECTSLHFTVADNLKNCEPDYGDMQLPKIKASSIMEFMMHKGVINGKWVRVGDEGYRLEGESDPTCCRNPNGPAVVEPDLVPTVKAPAAANSEPVATTTVAGTPDSDSAATVSKPTPETGSRRWLIYLSVGVVACALGGVIGWRFWKVKAPIKAPANVEPLSLD